MTPAEQERVRQEWYDRMRAETRRRLRRMDLIAMGWIVVFVALGLLSRGMS